MYLCLDVCVCEVCDSHVLICVSLRYHGQIGASLILGGVDCTGNHLYTVGPYGSVNEVPYLAMGM